ncbi:MAG: magnetosome biogenesis CDF transporter MamM [Magnetococcales bacterium]|nr:magnetosome biogenesis CDF transporter MamM [Magnetococcales bacterium]NGZ07090.1 magnetosome biogenesis CDF transporter MamM [Magnetococcales bacterium]
MSYPQCLICHRTVGWTGLVVNIGLSLLKLFVGFISGSQALMIDALYSLKDVLTSFLILLGLKYSKKPIDEEHQFGHGKAEFLFSLVVGLSMIIITGMFIYFEADKVLSGAGMTHKAPHMIALWTALFVVGANIYMWYYTRCVAHQVNSPIVAILSDHQKSDAISSMAVALGIIGSHYLNMPWLDTLVAVGECLDLFHLGVKISMEALQGLMDVSAPQETVQKVHELTRAVAGVKSVESVRTRRVGQDIWITLVIGTDPELTIERAKEISLWVEERLVNAIPHLGEVSVHFKSASGTLPELQQMDGEFEKMRQSFARRADTEAPDLGVV